MNALYACRACLFAVLLLAPALAAAQDSTFAQVPITLPQDVTYRSAAPADYDSDGDVDLLVIRSDAPGSLETLLFPELYRNDGVGTDGQFAFALAPFPAPPYPALHGFGDPDGETVSWADYDGDGDVDALVATHAGTALYRNDGGTFADAGVALPAYEEIDTWYVVDPSSSAWADFDNDGDLDLALPEPGLDGSSLVLYENDGGALVPSGTPFPPYIHHDLDLTWGDVDNDGDLDLLYLGTGWACDDSNPTPGECLVLYENEAGALVPRPIDGPALLGGAADFGDFDLDGDLDVFLAAKIRDPFNDPIYFDRAIVYRNDGETFVADTLEFPFEFDGLSEQLTAGQWADYDSDGDLDLLIGANVNDWFGPNEDFGGAAFVFANDGGAFTLTATLPATESYGTATWADFDTDGDLDFLSTGSRVEVGEDSTGAEVYFARLYRNDAPDLNARPSEPGGLAATPTADGVALAWGPASDDHTPAEALTYNLWVRTPDGRDVVTPMSRPAGKRLLPEPGNVSLNRSWTLSGLPEGEYAWGVQAVDNAFNGGPFADGGLFTVGALALTLEPEGAPIVIPASGGAFRFRATLTNLTDQPQTLRAGTEAVLPGGGLVGPLYGPAPFTLAPGETLGPITLSQRVPAGAPAGAYEYRAKAGGGGSAVASASFPFEKEASAGRAGEGAVGAEGWAVEQVSGTALASAGGAGAGLPSSFAVSGVYPNPVRGAAVVRVDLPARASVTVRLYDVLGRAVLASASGVLEAGLGRVFGLDVSSLPPGVYVYRVEAALPGGVARGRGQLTIVR